MRALFIATVVAPVFAAGLSFLPDTTFKGSSLAGWRLMGQADWQARDGEIIGTAKGPGGGWLMTERAFQDVAFHASFRCTGTCETGVLFRAEKVDDGVKGVFVSLTADDLEPYSVTLDSLGRILKRDRLRPAGGTVRIAPPPNPNAAGRGRSGGGRGAPPAVPLPLTRPDTSLRPGDWNTAEIFLDANIVRLFLNNGGEIAGAADDDAGKIGPLALYVKGSGEVRFKELSYKDLAQRSTPPEKVSSRFRLQRLNEMYYSWSAAAGDFNHDGVTDIVAGPHIFYGPTYRKWSEIYPASPLNPSKDFTGVNCQYAFDFDGDGWTDILTGPPRATLYINPKGESRRWDKFEVVPGIQSEVTVLQDINGDRLPDLVYAGDGAVRYATADPADPRKPWIVHQVSEQGYSIAHGIGAGDINGDGRIDILNPYGWWEQPPASAKQELWTYHPETFARYGRNVAGGSVMAVFDANGDGLNDVVTSLNAHGFGLAWFEQKRDAAGKISFVEHMISDDYSTTNAGGVTFSQPHGSTYADVDGDGVIDFIVGKRYWTHLDNYFDPDPFGPPVLYWYRTVRNPKAPGGAEFVPELIHNQSGAGSDVFAADLNKDGLMDIVTATRFGAFIFWGKKVPAPAARK